MNSKTLELSAPWHDALAVLLAIISAFALVEQILTLKILLRRENRRKRLTPYLINLAVTNLIFVCSSYTLSMASHLSRRFVSSKPVCILFGYIASATVLVTFASFTASTCLVYRATKELTKQLTIARNKDVKVIMLIWFDPGLRHIISDDRVLEKRLIPAGYNWLYTHTLAENPRRYCLLRRSDRGGVFRSHDNQRSLQRQNLFVFCSGQAVSNEHLSATQIPRVQECIQDDNCFSCGIRGVLDSPHYCQLSDVSWLPSESRITSSSVLAFQI